MKKLLIRLAILGAVGVTAAVAGSFMIIKSRTHDIDTSTQATSPEQQQALIAQGEYIARLSDCAACHTVPGGTEYAGGLAMQTPFGAIYSTNITPDKETGIGNYTLQEFANAVKHGVRKDGAPLYPAMPYASYTIMPDSDMVAMYEYFMNAVPAVKQENAPTTFPAIMSMRWPVAYWQMLFAPIREFKGNSALSGIENHGAYIVEGPGHCGACHTPRGIAYQEKALTNDSSDLFLSGALIDGWRAKSLRGEGQGLKTWSEDEIVEFLKTGRTDKVAAFGAMGDVVEHSSQYWTEQDLNAVASYLKTLSPAPGKSLELKTQPDTTTDLLLTDTFRAPGAVLYMEHCTICHRVDGEGVPRIFPALNQNTAITAQNAQSVIQITLEGGVMPATPADRIAFGMPSFAHLSDEEVATVINFIRNSWNNVSPEVSPQDVAEIHHFLANKAPNISSVKEDK